MVSWLSLFANHSFRFILHDQILKISFPLKCIAGQKVHVIFTQPTNTFEAKSINKVSENHNSATCFAIHWATPPSDTFLNEKFQCLNDYI